MSGDKSAYEEFLLSEYNNIAQAHHNTVNSISTFFRHYLLVVSLPVPLLALVGRVSEPAQFDAFLKGLGPTTPIASMLIALSGFFVMCYIVSLRFDAILYARAVNGIRRFFTDHADIPLWQELGQRVLPRSTVQPPYFEPSYFLWAVLTLALINSAYLGGAATLNEVIHERAPVPVWPYFWLPFGLGCVAHVGFYYALARRRETGYLKSRIVAIDIDGVIGDHRPHFCKLLAKTCQKTLKPEDIVRIPVHEIPNAGVTKEDEHAVFNTVEYWSEMPVVSDAAEVITELRGVLGYQVILFTHRPWPNESTFPVDRKDNYLRCWKLQWHLWRALWSRALSLPLVVMRIVTKKWLSKNSISYDRLYLEGGKARTVDTWFLSRNRQVVSGRSAVRVFVEDDLPKALRLATVCDVVFLLDHPYNRQEAPLPKNVQRVQDWREIHKQMRDRL